MVRLILVDDHNLFLSGLASILGKEPGITILDTAKNGLELLNLMEKGANPNIILSDIRMPIMNGLTITKLFKNKYPKVSIIALSMFDQEVDVIEMLDAGAKGYVVKNVEKEELLEAINKVAKGEYYLSPKFAGIYEQWSSKENKFTTAKLTRRERQILELIVRGRTSQQMAIQLCLSRFTIDTHRKNIHKKLGIKSNLALVKNAHKWIDS